MVSLLDELALNLRAASLIACCDCLEQKLQFADGHCRLLVAGKSWEELESSPKVQRNQLWAMPGPLCSWTGGSELKGDYDSGGVKGCESCGPPWSASSSASSSASHYFYRFLKIRWHILQLSALPGMLSWTWACRRPPLTRLLNMSRTSWPWSTRSGRKWRMHRSKSHAGSAQTLSATDYANNMK